MSEVIQWIDRGGAPPWRALTVETARAGLVHAESALRASMEWAKGLKKGFTWAAYERLDSDWTAFDAAHKLCLGGHLLALPGFDALKPVAEDLARALAEALERSRGLAQGIGALKAQKSLPAWRRKALEATIIGASGYARREARRRQEARGASVARLEKLCAANIATSLAMSPVWTNNSRDLKGLPSWLVESGRVEAAKKGWNGWVFHANFRQYRSFMANAESREMRRLMYQARSKAGSEFVSGCDNAMLAKKILATRRAEAKEYGHESYAHYVLGNHMLDEPELVEGALLDFASHATPCAFGERQDLDTWMKMGHDIARLEPWDYRFARTRMEKEVTGDVMGLALQYFAPTGTIERAVQACAAFLGVSAQRRREREIDDLLVFEIASPQGFNGHITIVPRARPVEDDLVAFEWTLAARSATRLVEPSTLVFLQMETSGGRLVNFSHCDVVTLFHELGHAFHAVLGEGRHSGDDPTSIEADALEMHSQLLERLAWEPKVLMAVGRRKSRSMPQKIAERISVCRNFHAGAWTIAQVTDALCDIRLHSKFNPRGRLLPWEVMVAIKREVGVDSPKSYNRQAQQLGTFTGSYVCGDYAYLWSEGLAHKIYTTWRAASKGGRRGQQASDAMRKIFFDQGARVPMAKQIAGYVGEKPQSRWLAESRELIHE